MPAHGEAFPFVRMLGPVALIGVNSAVPTPPLVAWAALGAAQLERLAAVLERLAGAGVFRLVLIHHPPLPGQAKRYRGLEDAAALEARAGAARRRAGHPRPQPSQHAGLVRHERRRPGAGGRRAVGVARAAAQARAAGPLQPLSHRRAALDASS